MKIWYDGSANFMFELLINMALKLGFEIIHEVLAHSTHLSGRYLISFFHLSVISHYHSQGRKFFSIHI